MFALSHQEFPVRRTPAAPRARAALLAVRSASLALAFGIAAASVLVGSQVAFGQDPIGGTSGLFALYAATAAVGVGLELLHQLRAVAKRLAESLTPPPAKVIKLPESAPAADSQWASRPISAA